MTDTEQAQAEPSIETPIEMPTEAEWEAFFAYRDRIKLQLLCLQ